MRQIPLPLHSDKFHNNLIITACNRHLFERVSSLKSDERVQLLIIGENKSGKNLFGRYFEQETGGLFVKNVEKLHENKLFFSWNKAHDEGRSLLMTADCDPVHWDVSLPDLKSRIASMELLKIGPPDDELVAELINQQLYSSEVAISAKAVAYAQKRIERDYQTLTEFVDQCIAIAKEQNRAIKLEDVKSLLYAYDQRELL